MRLLVYQSLCLASWCLCSQPRELRGSVQQGVREPYQGLGRALKPQCCRGAGRRQHQTKARARHSPPLLSETPFLKVMTSPPLNSASNHVCIETCHLFKKERKKEKILIGVRRERQTCKWTVQPRLLRTVRELSSFIQRAPHRQPLHLQEHSALSQVGPSN